MRGGEEEEGGGKGVCDGKHPPELIKVDGAVLVDVEHADHHLDGVRVEGGEIAVDERAAELLLRQRARAVRVDCLEEREERGVGAAVGARGRWGGRRA